MPPIPSAAAKKHHLTAFNAIVSAEGLVAKLPEIDAAARAAITAALQKAKNAVTQLRDCK
jgi:hypothetical protein